MYLMDHEREFAIRELMRDLGWLPSDLNCQEKMRLAEEYMAATIEWAEACQHRWMDLVDRHRQSYSVPSSTGYKGGGDLAIDEARLKTAPARLALEAHLVVHNC